MRPTHWSRDAHDNGLLGLVEGSTGDCSCGSPAPTFQASQGDATCADCIVKGGWSKPALFSKLTSWRDLVGPCRLFYNNLHEVLNEGNLDDESVELCVRYAEERGDEDGVVLGMMILAASYRQRVKAVRSLQPAQVRCAGDNRAGHDEEANLSDQEGNSGVLAPISKPYICTYRSLDGPCAKPAISLCRNYVEYPDHRSGFMLAIVGRRVYCGCDSHPVKSAMFSADTSPRYFIPSPPPSLHSLRGRR